MRPVLAHGIGTGRGIGIYCPAPFTPSYHPAEMSMFLAGRWVCHRGPPFQWAIGPGKDDWPRIDSRRIEYDRGGHKIVRLNAPNTVPRHTSFTLPDTL